MSEVDLKMTPMAAGGWGDRQFFSEKNVRNNILGKVTKNGDILITNKISRIITKGRVDQNHQPEGRRVYQILCRRGLDNYFPYPIIKELYE